MDSLIVKNEIKPYFKIASEHVFKISIFFNKTAAYASIIMKNKRLFKKFITHQRVHQQLKVWFNTISKLLSSKFQSPKEGLYDRTFYLTN